MDKKNSKLVKGALAGVAVVALAAGGSTWSAFSDFQDVTGNHAGAGFLRLNLNNQTGQTAAVPIDWGNLAPGYGSTRMIWLASNDGDSVPSGTLSATFSNLQDQENSCSSHTEEVLDDCEAGGTPGEVSHFINFQTSYYPELTQDQCATYPSQNTPPANSYKAFFPSDQGNLVGAATGAGNTYKLKENQSNDDLVLDPGEGVCIGFTAYWPVNSTQVPEFGNDDNWAQGDSMSFDIRFTLEQVGYQTPA